MKNKTCGKCKYYKPYNEKICLYIHRTCVSPKTQACRNFEQATLFDHITQSQEVLAPLLVREYWMADGPHIVKMWVSKIVPDHKYKTEAEAIVATLIKLKEVYNETPSD